MTEIVVATNAPFAIEAMVFEEDTWLLMSAGNRVGEIRESTDELQSKASDQQALPVGEVLITGSRWYAIVHDINSADSDREKIVDRILTEIFSNIVCRQIEAIGIQTLAGNHSGDPGRFVEKIKQLHESGELPDCLRKVWIQSR